MPTFTSMAEKLLIQAKQLDKQLSRCGCHQTSFDNDTMEILSPEAELIRNSLVDSAQDIKRLAQGTRGAYAEILFTYADELVLRAVYKFRLANFVPLNGTASFEQISAQSGLRVDLVERFLRQAMSNRIFTETEPGQVTHTALSRALVQDSDCLDGIGLILFDCSPCGMRTLDALEKWGGSFKPEESAWSLEHADGAAIGLYQHLASQPERARRFGAGMRYFGKGAGWNLSYLVDNFKWDGADRESATFVDIGGGHGTVSQALARSTSNIKFVVQDLPGTCASGVEVLPADLKERVSFAPHDFFSPQTIQADILFFRWILHNWSDEYCIRILRAQIPALKRGARLINYEFVLKDGPEHRWSKKLMRNQDMIMQAQFNAAERTERGWQHSFQRADPRLRVKDIITIEGSLMSIIEAELVEEPVN